MTEKKKIPIGRWIVVAVMTYLTIVIYIITHLVEDMSYMWPYSFLFIACGVLLAPPLKNLSVGIKTIIMISTGILVVTIIHAISSVTLGTAIGHFLSIFVMGYFLLYIFGFLVIAMIVGFFILLGYLFGPCCCCWYWWD